MVPVDDLHAVGKQVGSQVPDPFRAVGRHTRVGRPWHVLFHRQAPQRRPKGLRRAQDRRVAHVERMDFRRLFLGVRVPMRVFLDIANGTHLDFFPALPPNVDHPAIHADGLRLCMILARRRSHPPRPARAFLCLPLPPPRSSPPPAQPELATQRQAPSLQYRSSSSLSPTLPPLGTCRTTLTLLLSQSPCFPSSSDTSAFPPVKID